MAYEYQSGKHTIIEDLISIAQIKSKTAERFDLLVNFAPSTVFLTSFLMVLAIVESIGFPLEAGRYSREYQRQAPDRGFDKFEIRQTTLPLCLWR